MKALFSLMTAASIALTAFVPRAMAQDLNGLALPPDGATIINFSASERRSVPQDLLIASLRIEEEDKSNPVTVQNKINEAMTKALALAKKESAFKVSTGGYSVYKYDQAVKTDKNGNTTTQSYWRGSQTLQIESKDSTKLLEVVGKIQAMGFAMNNLAYTLSPDLAETTRDELITLALKKLLAKADLVAKTLGKSKAELVDVNVDTGGPIMPMYKTMMARGVAMDAAMEAAPPVAEASETDVMLTVSARALIK